MGFAVPHVKSNRMPELARWKYKIKIEVEETRSAAQNRGFSTRLFEGQPKNLKGKNGWGEPYPLGQCEISGSTLSANTKIQISPKMTQIYFFGQELMKPSKISIEAMMPFLKGFASLVDNLEKTERLMNDLAIFLPEEKLRFDISTRIQTKVPAMYRLIITSEGLKQDLLDDLVNQYYVEIDKVYADMFGGRLDLARGRLDELIEEIVFFQRDLIKLAKDWKDPNAEKWETNLNKMLFEIDALRIPKLPFYNDLFGQ